MRKPSPETEIRNLKSKVRALEREVLRLKGALRAQETKWIRAHVDAEDWKRRFDLALERIPIPADNEGR